MTIEQSITVPDTIYLQIEDEDGNPLPSHLQSASEVRVSDSDATYKLASVPMADPLFIYIAVNRERRYQDRKYGPIDQRQLTVADYLAIARAELDEAQSASADGDTGNALRELLQVVAVGVACLERHGIVER